jgi:hypothetical protein
MTWMVLRTILAATHYPCVEYGASLRENYSVEHGWSLFPNQDEGSRLCGGVFRARA